MEVAALLVSQIARLSASGSRPHSSFSEALEFLVLTDPGPSFHMKRGCSGRNANEVMYFVFRDAEPINFQFG